MDALRTIAPEMPEVLAGITPEVRRWLWLLLLAVGGTVLLADLGVLALHVVGARRGRPLLAPRWSIADVFLGLQLFLGLTLFGMILLCIPLVVLMTVRPAWAGESVISAVMLLVLIWQNVAMVATVALFVHGKYGEPLRAAGLSLFRWRQGLAAGCIAALLVIPLSDLISQLTRSATANLGPSTAMKVSEALTRFADVEQILGPLKSPLGLGPLILVIGIVAPFGEEVFFRGFAYTAMRRRLGVLGATILSALLFALIHTSPMAIAPIFLIGVLLAVLYERTGTLAASFALHAVNNTVAVLMYYFAPNFSFWGWLFPPHG
jgi:membrane protease YdiL (CAAX protease family)